MTLSSDNAKVDLTTPADLSRDLGVTQLRIRNYLRSNSLLCLWLQLSSLGEQPTAVLPGSTLMAVKISAPGRSEASQT